MLPVSEHYFVSVSGTDLLHQWLHPLMQLQHFSNIASCMHMQCMSLFCYYYWLSALITQLAATIDCTNSPSNGHSHFGLQLHAWICGGTLVYSVRSAGTYQPLITSWPHCLHCGHYLEWPFIIFHITPLLYCFRCCQFLSIILFQSVILMYCINGFTLWCSLQHFSKIASCMHMQCVSLFCLVIPMKSCLVISDMYF